MSRQVSQQCVIAIVDFGITKGNFMTNEVILTSTASQRVFRQISIMVNRERLNLIHEGHIFKGSVLRKIPAQLIGYIVQFLIYP